MTDTKDEDKRRKAREANQRWYYSPAATARRQKRRQELQARRAEMTARVNGLVASTDDPENPKP